MRTPAKILLAGTFAAILPCAAATSQTLPSTVENGQIQSGDIFANQTLDVVEATDGVTGATIATGNSADFTVDGVDLNVRSDQQLYGQVTARTDASVGVRAGDSSTLSTAATGNTGDAGVYGGAMSSRTTQFTDQVSITANSSVHAEGANGGDFASSTQAIGNSQGLYEVGGAVGALASQTNRADVTTSNEGTITRITGQANFVATAAANNATVTGGGSGQRAIVNQSNEGALTQAGAYAAYGNVYLANTQATATGNNITASEQSPVLDLTTRQQNLAYVRAETAGNGYLFGAGTASAYAIGNSLVAGNVGPEITLDNTQYTGGAGGGVDAYAEYVGYDGYDASSSAIAMGNAVSGYACSDCRSTMSVNNQQNNGANVNAESHVSVNSGRSVRGVATAVGNTASYYVSRPQD
jgi:hypothetical protein